MIKSLLWILVYSSSDNFSVVRKISQEGTQSWMWVLQFLPNGKSMSLNSNEQELYLFSYSALLSVVKIRCSDGTIQNSVKL